MFTATTIAALITLLTEAPQLVNGAKDLWAAISTFHSAGLLQLDATQVAAMNAAGVQLSADIAAAQAAAGPKPA